MFWKSKFLNRSFIFLFFRFLDFFGKDIYWDNGLINDIFINFFYIEYKLKCVIFLLI